jgi:hypothetical protein
MLFQLEDGKAGFVVSGFRYGSQDPQAHDQRLVVAKLVATPGAMTRLWPMA